MSRYPETCPIAECEEARRIRALPVAGQERKS